MIHKTKVAVLYIPQLSFLLCALSSFPHKDFILQRHVAKPTLLHVTPWEMEGEKPTDKKMV